MEMSTTERRHIMPVIDIYERYLAFLTVDKGNTINRYIKPTSTLLSRKNKTALLYSQVFSNMHLLVMESRDKITGGIDCARIMAYIMAT